MGIDSFVRGNKQPPTTRNVFLYRARPLALAPDILHRVRLLLLHVTIHLPRTNSLSPPPPTHRLGS
jgi:hypothetical protein